MCALPAAWSLQPFEKCDDANPCLTQNDDSRFHCPVRGEPVAWERKDVFNPAAVVRHGRVYLLYRAEDEVGRHAGTSRIGLAESADGLHFTRRAEPVLYPDNDFMKVYEWEGGIEDPRVVEAEDGRYVMTYTAYDGVTARLCVASSADLMSWTKHGLAFGDDYADQWAKSGAIVSRRDGDHLIAARIDGCYWMYWGESKVYMATSDDLIRWQPVFDAHDHRDFGGGSDRRYRAAFTPRANRFDSDLVEAGPPALLTDDGIVLIYNGKNNAQSGDPSLAAGTYAGGQALLDPRDPGAVIARLTDSFIHPERDYEISGQVNHVCFVEGLVHFGGQWLLYYGTADSKIAVARLRGG
jgi:predicted GH43/DUF377 family glycosyl hydrolase